jgi:Family of unknown function (DUF5996)
MGLLTYDTTFGEFLLPCEAVRTSATAEDDLLAFFSGVYEAGATLGRWDRALLEKQPPRRRLDAARR